MTTYPATVAEQIVDALNRRDLVTYRDLVHPDLVQDFVVLREYDGVEAVAGFFEELFAAFPDFALEVVDLVGDGVHAVLQWRATGTFTGEPFQGVHATGRHVALRGCDVMRFDDGRLRHNTVYYDGLAFARQVGLLPREGSPGDKALTSLFNVGVDVWSQVRAQIKRDR